MPTTIKLKNSVTTTNAPSSLAQGEVAINITDKKVWVGNAATTPIQLLGDGGSVTFTSLTVTGVSTFSAGTVSAPSITTSGDTNTGMFFPAADTIAFTEGGVESMRIDSSGNVGVGTSSPATKLDVNGTLNTSGIVNINGSGGGNTLNIWGTNGVGVRIANTSTNTSSYITQEASSELRTNAASFCTWYTGGSEKMRIDSSGNVGIGTSSPSAPLDVQANTNAVGYKIRGRASDNYSLIEFVNNANNAAYGYIGCPTSNNLAFFTNGLTERMRIDSSGNVGIGTSSPQSLLDLAVGSQSYNPTNVGQLRIAQTGNPATTNNGGIEFVASGFANGYGYRIASCDEGSGSTPLVFLTRLNSASWTERMRLTNDGSLFVGTTSSEGPAKVAVVQSTTNQACVGFRHTLGATESFARFINSNNTAVIGSISNNGNTATAYNTTSDYRLKENIAPMTGALNKVAQLKPVTYTWKSTGEIGQGFIAHELQAVVPDCVNGEKDAVDADGNPKYQGVDTSFLVATLTSAIQELHEIVKAQAAEIALLKSK